MGYGYASKTRFCAVISGARACWRGRRRGPPAATRPKFMPTGLWREGGLVRRVVGRPGIDLVVIATPNDTASHWRSGAGAGNAAMVVDKPFTVTLSQARELEELAAWRCCRYLQSRRWDSDFNNGQNVNRRRPAGRGVLPSNPFRLLCRPQVRQRWREQAGGSGIWYDLGPSARPGGGAVWSAGENHGGSLSSTSARRAIHRLFSLLAYPQRRVVCAALLAAAESARFIVHGSRASFIKYGLDPPRSS